MKLKQYKKAIILRQKGLSIKEIAKTLQVSKGSVSVWVKDVVLTKQKRLLLKKREHSRQTIEKRRVSRLRNELVKREGFMQIAGKDIQNISQQELKIIGSVLYWAEGRKRGHRYVSFSNSDPSVIRIMLRFFREICEVPECKFRCHIHTHSHLNAVIAEAYWSKVTNIPLNQFYKTYSKPSKSSKGKADPLPYGTLDVSIGDVRVFLKIMGWISKISKILLDAPIETH